MNVRYLPLKTVILVILLIGCAPKTEKKVHLVPSNEMILIPGGTLQMGGDNHQAAANEFPKHQVQIRSFWMDATECHQCAIYQVCQSHRIYHHR